MLVSAGKMKKLKGNNELLCIVNKTNLDSKAIENGDKTNQVIGTKTNCCGGSDSIENESKFSYHNENSTEYWFQLSLEFIDKLIGGQMTEMEIWIGDR